MNFTISSNPQIDLPYSFFHESSFVTSSRLKTTDYVILHPKFEKFIQQHIYFVLRVKSPTDWEVMEMTIQGSKTISSPNCEDKFIHHLQQKISGFAMAPSRVVLNPFEVMMKKPETPSKSKQSSCNSSQGTKRKRGRPPKK